MLNGSVEFSYRDVDVYPPRPGETPADLIGGDAASDVEIVRLAKLDGRVIGGYRLRRTGETRFSIPAIAVCKRYRGRGIGRWLLGHAIGIAELKGARVIEVPDAAAEFFGKVGFESFGGDLRLCLTPE